jgi:hypothetical protein
MIDPVAVLAYALYDSESTGRLSEDPKAQPEYFDPEYFERARKLLFMIDEYRVPGERRALAARIRGGARK